MKRIENMNNIFNLTNLDKNEVKNLNPQILAFVGDGVYSLFIRNKLVTNTNVKITELHSLTTNFVKAKGQSNFIEKLLPILTEEELSVYKRARNYKTQNVAKNSSVADYRRATGLEALIGFLYLTNNFERLNEILLNSVGEK